MDALKAMDPTDIKMELTLPMLRSLIRHNDWNKDYIMELFEALVKRFIQQKQNTVDFDSWMANILYTIDANKIDPRLKLGTKKCVIELVNDTEIDESKLLKMLRGTEETDKERNLEEILGELSPQNRVNLEKVKEIVSTVNSALKDGQIKYPLKNYMEKDLFKLCQAVKDSHQMKPRLTQMVSWCLLALSETSHLLQVRTGEGKSCIVAMFAAYRASKGDKVDIISSSPVLAERDAEAWKVFYKKLGLKVSCNTNVSKEADFKQCYKCDIVYGTTNSFAGDWLRHNFQRKEVRGDRKFQCVIVDEVDSLMLDKGLEVVYLSNKMPAMQSINTALLWIWCLVSHHKTFKCGRTAGPVQSFVRILEETTDTSPDTVLGILKMSVDKNIFPKEFTKDTKQMQSENVIQKLKSVGETQIVDFFRLVETQLPKYCFSLFSEESNGHLKELSRAKHRDRNEIGLVIFKGGLCRQLFSNKEASLNWVEQFIRKDLQFSCPEKTPEDSHIIGFQHLVYGKLRVWVENAFRATEMALGDEYVAHGETVVPVDYQCTGVVQNNMRWGDGLQQFLEMKHEAKVSDMTVITNFMSNVWLFKKYGNKVFGVTGTLGNREEIEMLQELYKGIQTSNVPTFRRRKLFEEEGKILAEEVGWLEAICRAVEEKVKPHSLLGGRAVLVICETINRAETIKKKIKDSLSGVKVKSYTDNNLDSSEIGETLNPSDVIIATNLAGRGTDLKVSEKVNKAGGLFVLQTFLPMNIRVEQQAFGRTGRQGNPGSAQLIMCVSHFSGSVIVEMETLAQSNRPNISDRLKQLSEALMAVLKSDSDNQAWQKLTKALDYLLTQMAMAESPIAFVKQARDNLVKRTMSSYLKTDIPRMNKKEILFSNYLDLIEAIYDKHKESKMLNSIVESMHECWALWLLMRFDADQSEETLERKFKEAMGNAQDLLEKEISPSSAVSFYIRHGNELRLEKSLEKSIEIYSKALEEDDQDFIALYNRALSTMLMKRENYILEALRDLEKAGESMERSMTVTEDALQLVAKTGPDPITGQITVFRNQLCVRLHVYNCLKKNINEALNKLKRAHGMGGGVTVAENHVFTLVGVQSFQYVVRHPIQVAEELAKLKLLGLTEIISLNTTFSLSGFFSKAFKGFF